MADDQQQHPKPQPQTQPSTLVQTFFPDMESGSANATPSRIPSDHRIGPAATHTDQRLNANVNHCNQYHKTLESDGVWCLGIATISGKPRDSPPAVAPSPPQLAGRSPARAYYHGHSGTDGHR